MGDQDETVMIAFDEAEELEKIATADVIEEEATPLYYYIDQFHFDRELNLFAATIGSLTPALPLKERPIIIIGERKNIRFNFFNVEKNYSSALTTPFSQYQYRSVCGKYFLFIDE